MTMMMLLRRSGASGRSLVASSSPFSSKLCSVAIRSFASLPDDDHHEETNTNSNRTLTSERTKVRSSRTSSLSKGSRKNKQQAQAQRVWKAIAPRVDHKTDATAHPQDLWDYWEDPVRTTKTTNNCEQTASSSQQLDELLDKIGSQEETGGRMRQSQLGVMREDPSEDMRLLMENYTVPALAAALRDREDVLQQCAELWNNQQDEELSRMLQPYQREFVLKRRRTEETLDLQEGLNEVSLEQLRKSLMRMPRRVTQAHQKRAGVVVALCNVHNVPSVLLEKRAPHLRAHPDEVCLPGGMVCSVSDPTIVATCLREMKEEIEGLPGDTNVLGVLRCNWGEVHHLVGVAVTPLVCFVGELGEVLLQPNPSEVSEVFTIPLSDFMDRSLWIHREGLAPIFTGGPHPIWGLTGYIMERFVKDLLARYDVIWPKQ